MQFRKRTARIVALRLFTGLLLAFSVLAQPSWSAAEELVIAHKGVPEKALTRNELRAMFGMRLRSWTNGLPVRVFVMPDSSPIHISFTTSQLSILPEQLRQALDRLVYSGMAQAPREVPSREEMRRMVGTTPGAIGYLPKEFVDDTVRVLEIR